MENEMNPVPQAEINPAPAIVADDSKWRPGLRKRSPRTQQLTTRVSEEVYAKVVALHEARRERFKNETLSRTIETALAYFLNDPLGESLRFKTR